MEPFHDDRGRTSHHRLPVNASWAVSSANFIFIYSRSKVMIDSTRNGLEDKSVGKRSGFHNGLEQFHK